MPTPQARSLARIARRLRREVAALEFGAPVTHVYDPLEYAWSAHRAYLALCGEPPLEALFVGMNPGPWGMVQTGVPFGEVRAVREWIGVEALVRKPPREHPARPVLGFACARSEVSGRRLWGWIARRYRTREAFFARRFVLNYCPLAFLEASGRNRTPDRLPARERDPLFAACDRALAASLERLRPRVAIGVGRFAAERLRRVAGAACAIVALPHPSPANPRANRGWQELADAALKEAGVAI